MFDLGWSEIFVIALVALIVVGPKDLPRVLRTVTQTLSKIKGLAREFQSGLDEMAREAELSDLKKDLEKVSKGSLDKTLADTVDPTGDVGRSIREIKDSVESDPTKSGSAVTDAMAKREQTASTPAPEPAAAPAPAPAKTLEDKYKSIGDAFDAPADDGNGKAAS